MKRITCDADIQYGLQELLKSDRRLAPIAQVCGPIPLRLCEPGFPGLAQIVVAQHVSKAAAAAVYQRLTDLINPLTANHLAERSEATLIAAGLTKQKRQTLRSIAAAVRSGSLNLTALCDLPAPDVLQQLTAINGIGRWTAEVYLLFCAGHPDIFPAGDVALRHSVQRGLCPKERLTENEVRKLARRWCPWRGVAARLFWDYYVNPRPHASSPGGAS